MRALFIVNPAAGHGRAVERWQKVVAQVRAGHRDTEVWHTRSRGDGAALARRGLDQGFEALVAVGGDGTIGEVVHGYLSAPAGFRERAVVGTWPAGSGCDTARHLGLTAEAPVSALLDMLAKPRVRRLDAGKVFFTRDDGTSGERYFINVAAMGLAGEVALRTERAGKRLGGTLSYLVSSIAALLRSRPTAIELQVDGARLPAGRYHMIALANSSSIGGGMNLAPVADVGDGRLDMVAVGDLSRLELLRHFPKIYQGTHLSVSGITHRLVSRVEATSLETVRLNIDGDALGRLPAVFEVHPGAVPFLCPAQRV